MRKPGEPRTDGEIEAWRDGYDWALKDKDHREKRRFTAAVAAMQGLLAHPECDDPPRDVASDAVDYADALLAALDAKPEGGAE